MGEVTDYEPPPKFPKFTHLKMVIDDPNGFVVQVEDHPERIHVYRGFGERLSKGYRRLPAMAARVNPYNYIIHVYDEYNRLCRVFSIPRCHPSYTFQFWVNGHLYQITAWTLDDSIDTETNDPGVFPDLSQRQVNNFRLWSF
jgi:hypothetical protein